MPLSLAAHLTLIEDEFAAARAAPLSARQAMLVAVLVDRYPDRVFAEFRTSAPGKVFNAGDVLAYRAGLARHWPALDPVFALCARREDAPRLVTGPVEVPVADYPRLSVEDYMVSLYNGNTVQRVQFVGPDGATRLAHEVLAAAIAALRELPG